MTSLVRSACLTNFADVAARCSLGALALLKEVGLPAGALEDPDLKVPALAVGRVLELAAARGMIAGVDVRMRVECARCGHAEDDTYEFDMPLAKAQAMESYEPGKCPECGAPIHMHLKRTQQRQ